ncbi:MAG: nucleotidyltransferase family protein [Gammaproteobacteria bacterium]|nr:nucleotidyltransferase family protein [Gammaproteobacteria bacterium]
MRAMILAAGRGERLRPLTDKIPKSLVQVRGESLLERHLNNVRAAGITDIVINLGWLGDRIVERIERGERYGLDVTYSDERGDVLETGGGIYKALPKLGEEPFLVVNADIYTDMPVPEVNLADEHLGHLVMVPTPDYRPHGDFDIENDLVRNGDEPAYTFSGVAIYRPELFAGCEAGRFPLAPLLREAADTGRLSGSVFEGLWADVGTPERLAALNA